MNGLTLIVIALVAGMTLLGYKKGFIRKLVGVVSWIVTLCLVSVVLPSIVEFLKESTNLYVGIQERLLNSDTEVMEMLRILGLETSAGEFVADKILRLIALVVTVVLVSLVVHGIAWSLRIASKLPLLKGANRIVGAVLGFVEGLLLVWILLLVISVCGTDRWGVEAIHMILESKLLTWLFAHNPLVSLLMA